MANIKLFKQEFTRSSLNLNIQLFCFILILSNIACNGSGGGSSDGSSGSVSTSSQSATGGGTTTTGGGTTTTGGGTTTTGGGTTTTGGGTTTTGGGTTSNIDVSVANLNGSNGIKFSGRLANDKSGSSVVSIKDFNGDGISDLAIGAELAELSGEQIATDRGLVYVFFGKNTLTSGSFAANLSLDPASLNGSNGFALRGAFALDHSGTSLASGDFNGDGRADIAIGAPGSAASRGRVYILFGHTGAQTSLINLQNIGVSEPGVQFIGPNTSFPEGIGQAVANLGDIDNDGIDDLGIGTATADLGSSQSDDDGKMYIVYGSSGLSSQTLDSSFLNVTNGFVLTGSVVRGRFGFSVSTAGDLNKDGRDDFIIGAPGANKAYVVFGKSRGSFTASQSADSSFLNGINGFIISHSNTQTQTGFSVSAAGDVNGDTWPDLLVGTPDTQGLSNGNVFLVFGRNSWSSAVSLSNSGVNGGTNPTVEGIRINPPQLNDDHGAAVAAVGDLDKDGFADILIGAPLNDLAYGLIDQSTDQGRSFVLYGHGGSWSNTTFGEAYNSSIGFSISGNLTGGNLGQHVAGQLDFNHDGWLDLLVSAPSASSSAGASYLIFGGP